MGGGSNLTPFSNCPTFFSLSLEFSLQLSFLYWQATEKALEYGIRDPSEVITVLQFLNDLGTIIYFGDEQESGETSLRDLVILKPQWLIDIFKTIITVYPKKEKVSKSCFNLYDSKLALPCLALPCLALPCLALPCLALPCHPKSGVALLM